MNEITTQKALEIIGRALSHDELKLSQKDHLLLIQCFKVLKDFIEPKVSPEIEN